MTDEEKTFAVIAANDIAKLAEDASTFGVQVLFESVHARVTSMILDNSPQYTSDDYQRARGYRAAVRND